MKTFIGVNYILPVNQLPSIPVYSHFDHFVGNVGIHNIFTRARYQEVLQNLHFVDNAKQDETDKGYKTEPIIDRMSEAFQVGFQNKPEQSIDNHMTKFRGHASIRQYLKMTPIKWGFKWWFQCASSIAYF